jgi:hypothetical protein
MNWPEERGERGEGHCVDGGRHGRKRRMGGREGLEQAWGEGKDEEKGVRGSRERESGMEQER